MSFGNSNAIVYGNCFAASKNRTVGEQLPLSVKRKKVTKTKE